MRQCSIFSRSLQGLFGYYGNNSFEKGFCYSKTGETSLEDVLALPLSRYMNLLRYEDSCLHEVGNLFSLKLRKVVSCLVSTFECGLKFSEVMIWMSTFSHFFLVVGHDALRPR